MKRHKRHEPFIHALLLTVAFLTFLPFFILVNNSFRTNTEAYTSYFGIPRALKNLVTTLSGGEVIERSAAGPTPDATASDTPSDSSSAPPVESAAAVAPRETRDAAYYWGELTRGYRFSWRFMRGYTLNTLFVAITTVFGVILLGSIAGYVFSRYRFPGHRVLFVVVLSVMMVPGVLTLVPSFMLVKNLGMLNSHWVLIVPYITGGQIMAIFLFKGFFDGLPEDLFEAARIDGAGHFGLYWNIVMPLSKPIVSVVAIINILGVWNNFMWPFITNSDARYHVIPSGLFLLSQGDAATNMATMNAAILLSGIPLLLLFIYATRPFMRGVTSGAFKA